MIKDRGTRAVRRMSRRNIRKMAATIRRLRETNESRERDGSAPSPERKAVIAYVSKAADSCTSSRDPNSGVARRKSATGSASPAATVTARCVSRRSAGRHLRRRDGNDSRADASGPQCDVRRRSSYSNDCVMLVLHSASSHLREQNPDSHREKITEAQVTRAKGTRSERLVASDRFPVATIGIAMAVVSSVIPRIVPNPMISR
jgi:hypothetical protein